MRIQAMEHDDNIEKIIEAQDLTLPPPEREPQRQYYFMAKCQQYIKVKSKELGRPLLCCIQTFGCQMNPATRTA